MGPSALIRRAIVITGVAGALLFTASTAHAATAAPATAPAAYVVAVDSAPATSTSDPASGAGLTVITPQATHTFSHNTSQRLYNAAITLGAGGVTLLCIRLTGNTVMCGAIAAAIIILARDGLAQNECYQAYTKWTPPFWGVRIVRC
jgi:hypothetical protein